MKGNSFDLARNEPLRWLEQFQGLIFALVDITRADIWRLASELQSNPPIDDTAKRIRNWPFRMLEKKEKLESAKAVLNRVLDASPSSLAEIDNQTIAKLDQALLCIADAIAYAAMVKVGLIDWFSYTRKAAECHRLLTTVVSPAIYLAVTGRPVGTVGIVATAAN